MNLSRLLLATCLTITCSYTQAALIKASNFEIGTEIDQLNDNTTISWLHNFDGTTKTLPVSIQKAQDIHGSTNSFIGSTWELWGLATSFYDRPSALVESLDDIYASSRSFTGMLITYSAPTRQLTLNGFDPYGDGFTALTFDKNGTFLNWQHDYTSIKREERCFELDTNGYVEQRCGTAFGGTLHFDSDVSYILIGGSDASLYIESLDASLPEPSILSLLTLAAIGFALRNRRRNRKELLNS